MSNAFYERELPLCRETGRKPRRVRVAARYFRERRDSLRPGDELLVPIESFNAVTSLERTTEGSVATMLSRIRMCRAMPGGLRATPAVTSRGELAIRLSLA